MVLHYEHPDTITELGELEQCLDKLGDNWIFRAQSPENNLTTSLERACEKFNYSLADDASAIEIHLLRQFARVYDGIDAKEVREDKLYCLSLMRHFGAPTRLLDFTYSKYVAIYFSLEYAYESNNGEAAIWCLNVPELISKVKSEIPEIADHIDARTEDDRRNNDTFEPLYWKNDFTFVGWENPVLMHRRLHLQQGVFLCPGNIGKSFETNLFAPYKKQTEDIRRYIFRPKDLQKAFEKLYRLNLTHESLFPGLDGLAQSMKYQLWLFRNLSEWRKGNFGGRK